jgi:hypothetical protein
MSNETTIKALEELAKSEYATATALDAALTDAEDNKLRRNYRKWRDAHLEQAEALKGRIKELGGQTTHHDLRDSNVYSLFWRLIRGSQDYRSLTGVRLAVGRGLRQYLDRLDDIDDLKTLTLLRKNLEAKQSEMQWYDDQVVSRQNLEMGAELDKTREAVKSLEKEAKEEEKKEARRVPAAPYPLAALVVAGAIGAAAYFIARRNEGLDGDDLVEEYDYGLGETAAQAESQAETAIEILAEAQPETKIEA